MNNWLNDPTNSVPDKAQMTTARRLGEALALQDISPIPRSQDSMRNFMRNLEKNKENRGMAIIS